MCVFLSIHLSVDISAGSVSRYYKYNINKYGISIEGLLSLPGLYTE